MFITTLLSYYVLNYFLNKHNCHFYFRYHFLFQFVLWICSSFDLHLFVVFEVLYFIGVIDYKTMYIYDVMLVLYLILMIVVAVQMNQRVSEMWMSFLFVLALCMLNIRKERIGKGDLYLLFASCLVFDRMQLCMCILLSCVMAFIYVILTKKERSERFCFAPFLCFGIAFLLI